MGLEAVDTAGVGHPQRLLHALLPRAPDRCNSTPRGHRREERTRSRGMCRRENMIDRRHDASGQSLTTYKKTGTRLLVDYTSFY